MNRVSSHENTRFENLRSTKETPLWEQPQNIGMCSLPLGGAKDWCLIHTLGAQGVKKKNKFQLNGNFHPQYIANVSVKETIV